MTHTELMDAGKKIFNFHPDEKFTSTEQILEVARKNMTPSNFDYYDKASSAFAGHLARYCDEVSKKIFL